MNELFYPTIDLFLYDLISGFDDTTEIIQESIEKFEKKIPQPLRETLQNLDKVGDNEFVKLFPDASSKIFELKDGYWLFKAQQDQVSLSGYYYPIGLSDTYSLLLDCSTESVTEPYPIQILKNIQTEITQRLAGEKATLGQTWLISAWLSPSSFKNVEQIARECYQNLMPQLSWNEDIDGQGKFLGGVIFELSRQKINHNSHVVIILYSEQAVQENLSGEFLNSWLRLFAYRHKIIKAYEQSRFIKQEIKSDIKEIQSAGAIVNLNLAQASSLDPFQNLLSEAQESLHSYTLSLPKLSFQSSTIDINLSNYNKRIKSLVENTKSISSHETNLEFLNEFTERVNDKYLLQIKKDTDNFELGLRLIEDRINTVRNQLELVKAERERNFQRLVTIVGAGTAATSFLDTKGEKCNAFIRMFSQPTTQNQNTGNKKELTCHPIFGFFFPILSIVAFGVIALGLKRFVLESQFVKNLLK